MWSRGQRALTESPKLSLGRAYRELTRTGAWARIGRRILSRPLTASGPEV
jgi:hypothetical protein